MVEAFMKMVWMHLYSIVSGICVENVCHYVDRQPSEKMLKQKLATQAEKS